jgi:hypothetical protein
MEQNKAFEGSQSSPAVASIDQGGCAFPSPEIPGRWPQEYGMTLRDYFAAKAEPFDGESSHNWIASRLGIQVPEYSDPHDWAKWYAMADAKWKYMQADAMIAARRPASPQADNQARKLIEEYCIAHDLGRLGNFERAYIREEFGKYLASNPAPASPQEGK